MMDFLLDSPLTLLNRWEPVHTFCSLSCVPLLLRLLSAACDWSGYHGRSGVPPPADLDPDCDLHLATALRG